MIRSLEVALTPVTTKEAEKVCLCQTSRLDFFLKKSCSKKMPLNSLDVIMGTMSITPKETKSLVKPVDASEDDVIEALLASDSIKLILTVGLGDWKRDKFIRRVQSVMGKKVQVFSADDHFTTDRGYKFEPTQIGRAHQKCQGNTRNALLSGKTVFVSNTHCRVEHLQTYANFKYSFIVVQFMPENVASAIAQGIGNDKNIPSHVFQQVYNDMISMQPSLNNEVFARLHAVYTINV